MSYLSCPRCGANLNVTHVECPKCGTGVCSNCKNVVTLDGHGNIVEE